MSTKEHARTSRSPRRRNRSLKPGSHRKVSGRLRTDAAEKEIFDLVRTGIERFILKNATVEDFLRTIRAVGGQEKIYAHQLTRSVLSTIVKEAIRKRNHKRSK